MKTKPAKVQTASSKHPERGESALTFAWWCLLGMVGLAPLVLGNIALSETTTLLGMWDATSLPKVAVILVLLAASLASFGVWAVLTRQPRLWWHPALWAVLGFAGWACVATLTSVSRSLSVFGEYGRNEGLIAYIAYAIVVFLAVQLVRSGDRVRRLSEVAVAAGVLVALYALVQNYGLDPVRWAVSGFEARASSTFGNPNMLADYLVFPFALAIGLALSEARARLRLIWWVALGVLASALVVTYTRGGWLGAGVAAAILAFVAWRVRWRPERSDLVAWALALIVVAAVALPASGFIASRISSPTEDNFRGVTNGRAVMWSTAVEAWAKRPILGWGPDTFARATRGTSTYQLFQMLGSVYADNAHNWALQLLVTLGAVGLAFSLAALLWALIASRRVIVGPAAGTAGSSGADRLLLAAWWAAIVGMLVSLMFGVTQPGVVIWLWLAVGVLLASVAKKRELAASWQPAACAAASIALALVVGLTAVDWVVADYIAGRAVFSQSPDTLALIRLAETINPLPQQYRLMQAQRLEAELNSQLQAGASPADIAPTVASIAEIYARAISHDPTDSETLLAAADTLNGVERVSPGAGYTQDALNYARRAAELGPYHWRTLAIYADALEAAGDTAQAAEVRGRAQGVAPADTQLAP